MAAVVVSRRRADRVAADADGVPATAGSLLGIAMLGEVLRPARPVVDAGDRGGRDDCGDVALPATRPPNSPSTAAARATRQPVMSPKR
ncbi:hypothetical protein I553_1711 [Mycobacterium xenopi 4042]|uniref:Uncharacterized protein n=1 Tax=Mycobacterium xenopi 4042 TaxID=1299334 RepID=X7ZCI5_MYCXE|nr:hypothetical protein I553_1711 [Mycobacterium xenopi 4042]